jgi:hypothetical protein
VQGRTLWDPSSAGLGGAERIAYRIEARDRDDISPNPAGTVGKSASSRTLYVIIQNPHESVEDRLERQRDLLERFVGDLAARLEYASGSGERAGPGDRVGEGRLRRPEPVAGGSEPFQGSELIAWGRDGFAGPSPSREVRNPFRVLS